MAGELRFGAVLFWRGFEFADGGKADKLFIVLGARQGMNVVAVICTSQARGKKLEPGCHAAEGYYFIPEKRDGFPLDTWVELHRAFEFSAPKLVAAMLSKEMVMHSNLRQELAAAIRNCFKHSEDASEAQIALLE